jgi:hypothetical protein
MKKMFVLIPALFAALALGAQEPDGETPKTPEQREKEFYESIDRQVERLTEALDLADWQIFMIDSTLTHDYKAMDEELTNLRMSKVSNSTAYMTVQDKWLEAIYQSYLRILNENQKAKYLKSGAAKAKKARDKRAEKALAAEKNKK